MKKIIIAITIGFFAICCKKTSNYYHGVVVDEKGIPIDKVHIKEMSNTTYSQSTRTYEDGTFKLYKSPDWISDLIFSKKGYITDTVPSVWSQYGEQLNYNFLNKEPDTITLKTIVPNNEPWRN